MELDLEKTHKDHQSQDILWFSWLKQGWQAILLLLNLDHVLKP